MGVSAEVFQLPDYERPPVVETVLGVQFDRLAGFRNAHLGAFWNALGSSAWSTIADAPPLRPQFERFDEETRWGSEVEFPLTQDPSSRMRIRNQQGNRMIQVQNGRLHFNGLGEHGGAYPRYEQVREEFVGVFRQFKEFVASKNVGNFRPNQWEVTYVNHIPKGTVWNSTGDWAFFRPLSGAPSIAGLIEGESFGGEWHFIIPPQQGRLHAQWQHAIRSSSEEEREEVIRLTLTARGPVREQDDHLQAVLEVLDLGRRTIVCSFQRLMTDEANRYWGLKNASN